MTVIIAAKKEDEIIVGADKRVTSGDMILDENASKIIIKEFTIENIIEPIKRDEFLIAFSGVYSLFELLKTYKPPVMNHNDTFFKYLHQDLIPSLNAYLRKYNFIQDCNGVDGVDWELLLVYQDKMYSIEYNLGIIEITSDYFASGTARDIAYGSLHTSKHLNHLESRVKKAIRACAAHSTKCNNHYDLYQSKPTGENTWKIQKIE